MKVLLRTRCIFWLIFWLQVNGVVIVCCILQQLVLLDSWILSRDLLALS